MSSPQMDSFEARRPSLALAKCVEADPCALTEQSVVTPEGQKVEALSLASHQLLGRGTAGTDLSLIHI